MKRVLWLARDIDNAHAELFRRRPKLTMQKGAAAVVVPCSCGVDCCTLANTPEVIAGPVYNGDDSLMSFCESGLEGTGIKIKPGQLLKLTIDVVPV